MIRILHVIGMMERAGAETFLMNTYRAMNRNEVQFDFLVHEMHECSYDAEIRRMGGRIFHIPRPSALNLYLGYRRTCGYFFSKHPEYRVVHGHMGSSAAVYLNEARKRGAYTVAHSHCVNYYPGIQRLEFAISSRPTRYVADYFMACSHEAGIDRFGSKIVDGPCFSVVKNGIPVSDYRCTDSEHEQAKSSLGLSGKRVIGIVGRLSPEKNHAFAFNVFAKLLEKDPSCILLVLGEGPLKAELIETADRLGISGSVAFLGSSDIVSHFDKAFDAFIFPSFIEGLGMAAIEAQAAGALSFCSENIPDDTIIAETCTKIPLSHGADKWADIIFTALSAQQQGERAIGAESIIASGYDISTTAAYLQSFYQDAFESASTTLHNNTESR